MRAAINTSLVLFALAAAGCAGAQRPAAGAPAAFTCKLPRGFVATKGAELSTERHGRGGRQVVVFVHDWGHDSSVFFDQIAALTSRYDVVVYDLRGHGHSTDRSERGAGVAGHARDLVAVIRARGGGEPVHLVGHDMGGWIALQVAETHPELVRSLTLIDMPASLSARERAAYRSLLAEYEVAPKRFRAWPDHLVAAWFTSRFLDAHPDEVARFDVIFGRHDARSVAGSLARLLRYHIDAGALPKLKLPVLFLAGAADHSPGVAAAEKQIKSAVDVTRLRIPNAGREPYLENPTAVNAALMRFFGGTGK